MRADEQRINPEKLRSRWLVVRVIQTNKCIAEKWRKLTACLFQLCAGDLRFQDLRQIGLHLPLGVTIVLNSCPSFSSSGGMENGAGLFNFTHSARQRKQRA